MKKRRNVLVPMDLNAVVGGSDAKKRSQFPWAPPPAQRQSALARTGRPVCRHRRGAFARWNEGIDDSDSDQWPRRGAWDGCAFVEISVDTSASDAHRSRLYQV